MGNTSKSRSATQIRGVAETRLRTKTKQTFHSKTAPQALLAKETVREYLAAFMCPWCERGPFKVVAQHTSRAHGVGPKELRDAAGVYYNTSLTDPETRAKNRQRGRARDTAHMRAARTAEHLKSGQYSEAAKSDWSDRLAKRQLSEAAKARNKAQLAAAREKGAAAAAAAAKKLAAERLAAAETRLREAAESGVAFSVIAAELNVSSAQVGRWAKQLGLPDGRSLAAKWRALDQEALAAGRNRAEAEAREKDSEEWESSDQSWEQIAVMATERGVSEKSMRARLRALGFDIGDGRRRPNRNRRTNYPAKRLNCEVAACERQHVARGMCQYHYRQWRIATGQFNPCSAHGCRKPVVGRGLCSAHYYQARK